MMLMLSPLSQRSLRLRSGLLTQREHTVQESVQSNDLCNSWMCVYVHYLARTGCLMPEERFVFSAVAMEAVLWGI